MKALCIVVFALIPSFSFGQNSEVIIRDFFQVTGGVEKWKKLTSAYKEVDFNKYSQIFTSAPVRTKFTKQRIYYKLPDKLKIIHIHDLKEEIVSYTDSAFWMKTSSGEVKELPGEHKEYYKNTSIKPKFHLHLLDSATLISYCGDTTINQIEYEVLNVKGVGWMFGHLYFFNKETKLLDFTQSIVKPGAITYSKDYRWVNGYLISFQEEMYVNNSLESVGKLTKIIFNLNISDEEFYP